MTYTWELMEFEEIHYLDEKLESQGDMVKHRGSGQLLNDDHKTQDNPSLSATKVMSTDNSKKELWKITITHNHNSHLEMGSPVEIFLAIFIRP